MKMVYQKGANCLDISLLESTGYSETGSKGSAKEYDSLLNKSKLSTDGRLQSTLWFSAVFLNIGCALVLAGQIIMAPIFSSLYSEGLGVIIMAIITGSAILGSIASTLTLSKLSCKTAFVLASCVYIVALAGNYYPTWYTLIPTAMIGGFFMAIAILAVRTYLGRIAATYSSMFGENNDRIYSRMFVVHVLCLKVVTILGNLCSSLILGTTQSAFNIDVDIDQFTVFGNYSDSSLASEGFLDICGTDYCNQDLGSSYEIGRAAKSSTSGAPTKVQFYAIISLCVVTSFIGILVLAFFVQDFKLVEDNSRKSTTYKLLLATFIQLKDPKLLLLLPLAVSQQCADSFWVADFNKAFITCSSGIQYVGYVTIWSGISGAVSCFLFGWFNKTTLRSLPLMVATLAHLFVLLVIYNWKPKKGSLIEMSAITAIWYLGSGIKLALVPALFGVVFSDNMVVAYSNLNMWGFIGSMTMFSWSHFLCMNVKIYILAGIVVTSYVGYVAVEIIIHYDKKNVGIATTGSQDSRVNCSKDIATPPMKLIS